MEKYNKGASLDINQLKSDILAELIRQWAEGSSELEKLLWDCYNSKVKTCGCDAGDHHSAYLEFLVEGSSTENIQKLITCSQQFETCDVILNFAGNPCSGPDWYLPSISLSPVRNRQASEFFSRLSKSLNNNSVCTNGFVHILDLYSALKDKESGLTIRFSKRSNSYTMYIQCFQNKRNWQYFTDLFEGAGFEKISFSSDIPYIEFRHEVEGAKEFDIEVKKLLEVLNNWSLDLPNEITDDMSFSSKALVMRRKLGNDQDGTEKFNKWIKRCLS